jgi:serine protease Do
VKGSPGIFLSGTCVSGPTHVYNRFIIHSVKLNSINIMKKLTLIILTLAGTALLFARFSSDSGARFYFDTFGTEPATLRTTYGESASSGARDPFGTRPSVSQSDRWTADPSPNTGSAASTPVQTLRDFNNAIVAIAERSNPAVVTVTTAQTVRFRQMDPFSMFFGEFGGQERQQVRRGLGSGVIVTEDGIIVTNHHVIEGADEIKVRLFEGDELSAEVVGSDPMMDIAILRVDRDRLPFLSIGDSDELKVGELVLALGSPLDESLAHSVSMGIVSAKGRSIGIYENVSGYENFIQTDAAINPGNSGGALVNMDGDLIGINSAIASRSGGYQGIGFAIPVNMVRQAMESILEKGRVVRGYLGITWGGDVDQAMAKALKLDQNFGVIVGQVADGGPADKAGLKADDVLTRIDGEPIRNWNTFRTKIASTRPGASVKIEFVRDGDRRTVNVTLGELEPEETASATPKVIEDLLERLGISVENLTSQLRSQLRLDEGVEGVVVSRIDSNSSAYRQGLRRGDVITQIQGDPVESSASFHQRLQTLIDRGEEAILFRVNRQGQRLFIAMEL